MGLSEKKRKKNSSTTSLRGGSLFSSKFSFSSSKKKIFYFFELGLFIFIEIFFFFLSKEEKIKNKKKYSTFPSLSWATLFSMIFSSSSSCQKEKKIFLFCFLRGVLYFHQNFLLIPVNKEERKKK